MQSMDPSSAAYDALQAEWEKEESKKKETRRRQIEQRRIHLYLARAAHYQGPADLRQFARSWAPRWLAAGHVLRALTPIRSSADITLPVTPGHSIAAELLDLALEGVSRESFARVLYAHLERLQGHREVWVLRQIFDDVSDFLRSSDQASEELCSARDQLTPMEVQVLRALRAQNKERLLTREIATLLGVTEKSLGKNLARLCRLHYLENVPRRGYSLTWLGRNDRL